MRTVFSLGLRPFFLLAGLWGFASMALWLLVLRGQLTLPGRLDPVSWHAHEFLFAYLSAVVAGFLLTAVPNWTGRPPIAGWRLATLAALWLLGRVGLLASNHLPPAVPAVLDLSFLFVLSVLVAVELLAARNWRNLGVLALLLVLLGGNALFHAEAASGQFAARGEGLRIGLAAAVMLISLIGGRIVPAFTRNWLITQHHPAPPSASAHLDRLVLLVSLLSLGLWVVLPLATVTGLSLLLTAVLHCIRLARWGGIHSGAEPLVWVLHVGYAFVPLGALALGASILAPAVIGGSAAQHLWMAGAVGVMTLAVMTRATLGHSGRALHAGTGTVILHAALIAAALLRFGASVVPASGAALHLLAGLAWCGAFAGFTLLYAPALLRAPASR